MIPKFPQFKKLEFSDREEIIAINSRYQPYADFNFENMWTWDVNDSVKISILNGNLVLLAKNIYTNEVICSYLGNNNVNETIYHLFDFLEETVDSNPKISFVPEISLKGMDFKKYFIEIDLSSCDYIYDLKHLSDYSGNQYMQKRGRNNAFVRNYPDTEVKILDLHNSEVKNEILNLNNSWVENKIIQHNDKDIDKDPLSIARFLDADFQDVYCVGVYQKELIGYAIYSFHGKDYAINQFIKADISYKGVYEFLMKESAKLLHQKGYKYLNFLEDMGLPGLRVAKNTYRPIGFLRKYFVNKLK